MHMDTAELEAIQEKLQALKIEHKDLDDIISRLAVASGQDELQLRRLKKRKLYIKDHIALLERQVTPSVPA
jgi:hypothetical protein